VKEDRVYLGAHPRSDPEGRRLQPGRTGGIFRQPDGAGRRHPQLRDHRRSDQAAGRGHEGEAPGDCLTGHCGLSGRVDQRLHGGQVAARLERHRAELSGSAARGGRPAGRRVTRLATGPPIGHIQRLRNSLATRAAGQARSHPGDGTPHGRSIALRSAADETCNPNPAPQTAAGNALAKNPSWLRYSRCSMTQARAVHNRLFRAASLLFFGVGAVPDLILI